MKKQILLFLSLLVFTINIEAQLTNNCGMRIITNVTNCTVSFSSYGSSVGGGLSAVWDFGDGSSYTDTNNNSYPGSATHTYSASGTYTYTLQIDTCILTDTITVNCNSTSFENILSEENFQISPNPFSSNINIAFENKNNEIKELKLLDNLGKSVLIIDVDNNSNNINLDLSKLKKGIYYLSILYKDTPVTKKLIKN